jgi:hypothetical protein
MPAAEPEAGGWRWTEGGAEPQAGGWRTQALMLCGKVGPGGGGIAASSVRSPSAHGAQARLEALRALPHRPMVIGEKIGFMTPTVS